MKKRKLECCMAPEDLGFVQPRLLIPKLDFSNSALEYWSVAHPCIAVPGQFVTLLQSQVYNLINCQYTQFVCQYGHNVYITVRKGFKL
jgi:hypothetical protein